MDQVLRQDKKWLLHVSTIVIALSGSGFTEDVHTLLLILYEGLDATSPQQTAYLIKGAALSPSAKARGFQTLASSW